MVEALRTKSLLLLTFDTLIYCFPARFITTNTNGGDCRMSRDEFRPSKANYTSEMVNNKNSYNNQ